MVCHGFSNKCEVTNLPCFRVGFELVLGFGLACLWGLAFEVLESESVIDAVDPIGICTVFE